MVSCLAVLYPVPLHKGNCFELFGLFKFLWRQPLFLYRSLALLFLISSILNIIYRLSQSQDCTYSPLPPNEGTSPFQVDCWPTVIFTQKFQSAEILYIIISFTPCFIFYRMKKIDTLTFFYFFPLLFTFIFYNFRSLNFNNTYSILT